MDKEKIIKIIENDILDDDKIFSIKIVGVTAYNENYTVTWESLEKEDK